MSKHEYIHGTKKLQYFVFRTRRMKTSEIIVDSDEILIRVPFSKPGTEIKALIKEKISWILMKQKEFQKLLDHLTLKTLIMEYILKIIIGSCR